MSKSIRALGLVSGGLDSTLAARLLIEQGIEVRGVHFNTGFCITEPRRRNKKSSQLNINLCNEALKVGADLKFSVSVVDISKEYMEIVTNPRWGYGKNANPCLDCRIMMLKKAREKMADFDAKFIFTGEVLAQRPMTQHKDTLRLIEKQSGLKGFLLRPLSALKLPVTEVERLSWVDRTRLKGFSGRSRKPQIALAKEFELKEYPQPAGGCCYLTDPSYGKKFFDFLKHLPPDRQPGREDFLILTVGRHFRISDKLKLIVGRNESENRFLESYTTGRWTMTPVEVEGPLALLDGDVQKTDFDQAAKIVARYSDGKDHESVTIRCERNGLSKNLSVQPMKNEEISQYLIQ